MAKRLANGRQIALLRGINVGTAKRVAMVDLRAVVEGLGYGEVQTLLNSGNIVFTTRGKAPKDAAARIEKAVEGNLGVVSRVTLLSAAELDEIVARNPLLGVATHPSRLLVAVLREGQAGRRLAPLAEQDWSPGALALGERVAYLWCPEGGLASPAAQAVAGILGDGVTTRNWSTILKIHALTKR
jgi:uncharacterized protein (DUF1697 family)